MKTNITLKLEQDLLREARILAAEQDTSISAIVSEALAEKVRQRKGYDLARKRALEILHQKRELNWERPASRDELHER